MIKPPSIPDQDLHRHSIDILWWYWLATLSWQLVKSWLIFEDMLSSGQSMWVSWHTANYWPSVDWVPNEMLTEGWSRKFIGCPISYFEPYQFCFLWEFKIVGFNWVYTLCTLTLACIGNKFMQAGENDVNQPCIMNIVILTELGVLGLFAC